MSEQRLREALAEWFAEQARTYLRDIEGMRAFLKSMTDKPDPGRPDSGARED